MPTSKYDEKLFENHTNEQLKIIYNVTKQRISQVRAKFFPHTNSEKIAYIQRVETVDTKILEYIKKYSNRVNISEFRKISSIKIGSAFGTTKNTTYTQILNKERFLKIAEKNGIKIHFYSEKSYERHKHGLHCRVRNGCVCEIHKFAYCIYSKIRARRYRQRSKVPTIVIDAIANEFYPLYNELNPTRKRSRTLVHDFYVNLFKQLGKLHRRYLSGKEI